MKKLSLVVLAMGLGLILTGGASWGRGPGGGSSRGSSATRHPSSSGARSPSATRGPGSNTRPTTRTPGRPGTWGGAAFGGAVRRTSRSGVAGDLSGGDFSGGDLPADVAPAAFGMAIRNLYNGTARSQGMKVGDIIMAVNGTATPDLGSLRDALVGSGSQAEVDFLNVDNGELERITLNPNAGAIGASVEQVQVD